METPMNIQEGKRKIIASLDDIDDEALIRVIQNMIDYASVRNKEYASESLAQYNESLARAEADIDAGHFVVHEKAMEKLSEWRNEKK